MQVVLDVDLLGLFVVLRVNFPLPARHRAALEDLCRSAVRIGRGTATVYALDVSYTGTPKIIETPEPAHGLEARTLSSGKLSKMIFGFYFASWVDFLIFLF